MSYFDEDYEDLDYEEQEDQIKTSNITSNVKKTVNYITQPNKATIYITKNGAFIPFNLLSADQDQQILLARKLENYFTIKIQQIIGGFKQAKHCTMDKPNRRIIVPRFGIFEVLNKKYNLSSCHVVSKLKPGNPPSKQFVWQGQSTHNQQVVIDDIILNHFNEERVACGSAGCIVDLEAGQGKSYLAANLIHKIGKKTAIILHSTSLLEQWIEVLRQCFGADISIGQYHSKKKEDGDIILLIVNSAAQNEFTITTGRGKTATSTTMTAIEYYNQFGFIIFDECHTYANNSALKMFSKAQAPYMLGLSATPNDNAPMDKLVWWSIGPIIYTRELPGYQSTINNFIVNIHVVNYIGAPLYTKQHFNKTTGMVSVPDTIKMICEDEQRSQLVIRCINKCILMGLYTFVFADRREYLEQLREMLVLSHNQKVTKEELPGLPNQTQEASKYEMLLTDMDYARIIGGTKADVMQQAAEQSKVIFTTYQYMGTGKSIPKMNGLVLATPRKTKMQQYIRRILRLGSDQNIERHVYDIVDKATVLKSQYSSRKKYYSMEQFNIDTAVDVN